MSPWATLAAERPGAGVDKSFRNPAFLVEPFVEVCPHKVRRRAMSQPPFECDGRLPVGRRPGAPAPPPETLGLSARRAGRHGCPPGDPPPCPCGTRSTEGRGQRPLSVDHL